MGQQIQFALSQSAHRVLLKMASILPGLVALLVAVLLFTLIGAGLSALMRKILIAIRFDERLARNQMVASMTNIQDWSPSHSPSVLLTRATFWGCFVLGVVIGILAFDAAYSGSLEISMLLLPYVSRIVGATLLFIAGNLIARFLSRSVLIGAVNARFQYARMLSLGVKWMVLVLMTAMVLDHLEIGGTIVDLAFGILFGGIVLALALAVGLGSRDLVSRSIESNGPRPSEATASKSASPLQEETRQSSPIETLHHF
jgi:hypothetical protein